MKKKSDIVEAIENVRLPIASANGHKICRMRSDNAKEFTSSEIKKLMLNNKIGLYRIQDNIAYRSFQQLIVHNKMVVLNDKIE